jgi:hypothetical protein
MRRKLEAAMFQIDLLWPLASQYELRPIENKIAICPTGDATFNRHRPLELNPSLYVEFLRLDGSEQSCLDFAHKYGLLLISNPKSLIAGEAVSEWRAQIAYLQDIIAFCEFGRSNPRKAWREFGNVERGLYAEFVPSLSMQGPRAPPVLSVRSTSLLGAITLQAILSTLEGRKSVQCLQCSKFFEVGPGARRSLAKFCSRRCTDAYHNSLKSKGKG